MKTAASSKIPSEILPGFYVKPDYCPYADNIKYSCEGCNQYIIKRKLCRLHCATMGAAAWRQSTGEVSAGSLFVRFGVPKMSDIIAILPGGQFLAIKVKADKGQFTQRQNIFIGDVMKNNGVCICSLIRR